VYVTPDEDFPIAPAGLQNAPGLTFGTIVTVGEGDAVGIGVCVLDGVGDADGVVVCSPKSGESMPHSPMATLILWASFKSTVSEYFFFTMIQDSKYWQMLTFGNQLATSLSPLDLFKLRETATKALLSVRSFAKA
jgi:hypothetical protein